MKYKWAYIENYAPLPGQALIKGSVGHAALGAWYPATVASPEKAADISLAVASKKLAEYEEEASYEMPEIWDDMAVILERYYEWALENDDFKAYQIEYKFDLEIGDFILTGFIDGLVQRNDGTHWILEHKFTKQVRVKHLETDPQISIYMLAARVLGFDVRGAFYNVIRTTIGGKAETEPVVRLPVFRNNEGLEQITCELILQMEEMRKFHEQNGEGAYRNPTMDCSWDCGFNNVCLAVNDDGDPIPALRVIPLKDYGK
jgi:hypothetical protein